MKELIELHSKPELAEEDGMVYQVWEDGEITLQKSGRLLWQRSLHTIHPGDPSKAVSTNLFPKEYHTNGHAFIFTDDEGSQKVRAEILK